MRLLSEGSEHKEPKEPTRPKLPTKVESKPEEGLERIMDQLETKTETMMIDTDNLLFTCERDGLSSNELALLEHQLTQMLHET
jgi:hypothetical protein